MVRSSSLAETWRAQAIGIDQLPAQDPVTRAPLTDARAVHSYQARLINAHERLHGPISFPTEKQFDALIARVPDEIHAEANTISREELNRLIAQLRFGNALLDDVPATHHIRATAEQFLRGEILSAAEKHPELLEARVHPYAGTALHGMEARARLATWFMHIDHLNGDVRGILENGYAHATPEARAEVVRNMAANHGGHAELRSEPHTLYFVNDQFSFNKTHRDGHNPAALLKQFLQLYSVGKTSEIDHLMRSGATRILGCEYKVHVKAAVQVHAALFDRLLDAVTHNPLLEKNIIALKIITAPEDEIADMVIYPRRGMHSVDARTVAELISHELRGHFADFDVPALDAGVPRYSLPLTNILSVAQSSGDLKEQLEVMGLLDVYFDDRTNYAFLRPEFQS